MAGVWVRTVPAEKTASRSSLSPLISASSALATCRRLASPSWTRASGGVSAMLHSSFCSEKAARCLNVRYFEMAS